VLTDDLDIFIKTEVLDAAKADTLWSRPNEAAFPKPIEKDGRMRKKSETKAQMEMFDWPDVRQTCPDVRNLPLILNPQGRFEVMAPGSVYQPILLTPQQEGIEIGPGKLEINEEKFVLDLIHFLYPSGNPPKSPKTSLKWGDYQLWLKRNIEKDPDSFRLRVDDSNWFYPDFILWIVDKKNKIQTLGFIDPKGLAIGAGAGWSDYKIVSTLYMPHVLETQINRSGALMDPNGGAWEFRIRGVLVSTTSFSGLKEQAKFSLRAEDGDDVIPDETDFRRARIVFQPIGDNIAYIETVLNLLTIDTQFDGVLKSAAQILQFGEDFTPTNEIHYELLIRADGASKTDAEYIGSVVRDYLKPDDKGNLGLRAFQRRRKELQDYAKPGRPWGFGAEKAFALRDIVAPCRELWERKKKAMAQK